jgi:hypothetical protein
MIDREAIRAKMTRVAGMELEHTTPADTGRLIIASLQVEQP